MSGYTAKPIVMGFHPAPRGFGWAVFEGLQNPYDWAITFVRSGDRHEVSLKHLRQMLERHRPETLVLESFGGPQGKRANPNDKLCAAAVELAEELGIAVAIFSKFQIRVALGLPENATRHAVAEVVAEQVYAFRHRLPPERRPWDSADRRMALFSAAALVLTHFATL